MNDTFISDDFMLGSETARLLYHEHAAKMPIYDYHCHVPAEPIAKDAQFENLTQVWLYGDHYKWRAMRTNGVAERYCTGDASDYEKFEKWAQTVPATLRNPLYHWTHLELKRYFDVDELLNTASAKRVYDKCSEVLNTPEFSVRNLMRKMNVKLVCTTEDPLDSLEHHRVIAESDFEIKVYTAWRPDKAMASENVAALNGWIDALAELTDIEVSNYQSYLQAIRQRHDFFHEMGCRLSDHGIDTAYAADYTERELQSIFQKIRGGKELEATEHLKFKSALLYEFALMDHEAGWVQQFHFSALRNCNTRMFKALGADVGFDAMSDLPIAEALQGFLDRLDVQNKLAPTILYNLNPRDNELMAAMIGSFQDGSKPGKMQYGSGWWFLDQRDGMTRQMNTLSNLGLLSRFVGMLTDSRSFLSYPRHEYFRRILCDILGSDVENGALPKDMNLLGQMVEDICFNNARDYFSMSLT